MPADLSSLAWGVLFNCLYALLLSVCSAILHTSAPLSTPVAFVYIFVGETLSTLPLVPVAWRHWTVRTRHRWAAFIVLGLLINANFMAWRGATAALHLGAFSAIAGSGVLFAPVASAVLYRRCVGGIDICGVVAAFVGVLLTTRPPFIFGGAVSGPVYAYFLAMANALTGIVIPFFFGATADEHWSNFLVLRLLCSVAVAGICLGAAGGFSTLIAAPPTAAGAVALVGGVSTIYRLAQQVGCKELEAFDEGLAGFLGSLITAGVIPATTALAAVLFGETLTPIEASGVVIVFVGIIVVTLAKGLRKRKEEREEEKEKSEELNDTWEANDLPPAPMAADERLVDLSPP